MHGASLAPQPPKCLSACECAATRYSDSNRAEMFGMFICEFQKIADGTYFGRSEHLSRETAEQHAITELTRLGEDHESILATVAVAGYGCSDTSSDGYGVRIFEKG